MKRKAHFLKEGDQAGAHPPLILAPLSSSKTWKERWCFIFGDWDAKDGTTLRSFVLRGISLGSVISVCESYLVVIDQYL